MNIYYHTIEGAWFDSCLKCMTYGHRYKITRGSFEGQERLQLDHLSGVILHPDTRPIHISLSGESVATEEQVTEYFLNYIMGTEVKPGETYTYGSRIQEQLPTIMEMLNKDKGTNHAVIEIGDSEDRFIHDPPCLRLIQWNVYGRDLYMSIYFRSWDLYSGFPMNMWGLQLLNEYVASLLSLDIGKLIFYSAGAHLYDYCWNRFE